MTETNSTDTVRVLASGTCRVGFAKSKLPLVDGMSMLGHSLVGQIGKQGTDELWARSLFLRSDNPSDRGLHLVFVDLWSASLPLWQAVAEAADVPKQSLLLFGTHTHTAPGRYVGSSFYELFGGKLQLGKIGFSREWTQSLAAEIATSVRESIANASEHQLVVTRTSVWRAGRNRSQVAFKGNSEAKHWNTVGYPGELPPAGLEETELSIDPGLDSLIAVDSGGTARAIFSFFGCHATALGPGHQLYDRDWPGRAVDAIDAGGVFGAIGISSAGDVTPLRPDDDAAKHQGEELAQRAATRVAEGMTRSLKAAEAEPRGGALSFAVTSGVWEPGSHFDWDVGIPMMAGAEDGRSHLPKWLAREGKKRAHPDASDPQSPKELALGCLQHLLRKVAKLELQPNHPWHRLVIGSHILQTVPLEPTGVAAYRLAKSLCATWGVSSVTVAGFSGDYAGYLTTEEEYEAQQYEGGSTLYGRKTLDHLIERLTRRSSDESALDTMTTRPEHPELAAALKGMLSGLETDAFVASVPGDDDDTSNLIALWLDTAEAPSSPILASDGGPRSPDDVATVPWEMPGGRRLRAARFLREGATDGSDSPRLVELKPDTGQ